LDICDEVVIEAVAGDPHAFREVYDALAPKVLGYLRARGVEDAEGLISEVFLGVYPRLAGLTGGAAGLRTLVFSVAHAPRWARSCPSVRSASRCPADLGSRDVRGRLSPVGGRA